MAARQGFATSTFWTRHFHNRKQPLLVNFCIQLYGIKPPRICIHIAMNHPFLDGNKRTAYAVMRTFLRLNGFTLNKSQDEKFEFVLRVANGQMGKDEIAAYLERSSVRRE